MAIIDDELFTRCRICGSEVTTGIRRTEDGLREDPPGDRTLVCHRCGAAHGYGDADYYHRAASE